MEWLPNFVLLIHFAATIYMVGLIWVMQVVHYPLFAKVGVSEFPAYEHAHRRLMTWIVALPMFLEGMTGTAILWALPLGIDREVVWAGWGLMAVNGLSTAFVQVPLHLRLSQGFEPRTHSRLVRTNWIRTIAWTLRGLLVLGMTWVVLATSQEKMNMAKLEIGDPAPRFTTTTFDGKPISLTDYLDKRALVIFFYPKDDSPICTKEACAFRDSYEKFTEAGAEVIGVSSDSDKSHNDFAGKYHLSFPLISDADGALRKAFAVPRTLGILPGRVTYVIDRQGIVRLIFSAQTASDEHVRKALAALDKDLKPGQ